MNSWTCIGIPLRSPANDADGITTVSLCLAEGHNASGRTDSGRKTREIPDFHTDLGRFVRFVGRGDTRSAGAASEPGSRPTGTTVLEEVDQHVVAQRVGRREERTPAIDAHHALDERLQRVALVEHERVDADA